MEEGAKFLTMKCMLNESFFWPKHTYHDTTILFSLDFCDKF